MLYNVEKISEYNKKIKQGIITIIVSFVSVLAILVVLGFLTNDDNYKILRVISYVLFIL